MQETVRIVGMGGSMAETSTSLAALKIALSGAEEMGAIVELFDIREMNLPYYVRGIANPPEAALRLADATCRAQGMIWSSPLYHGTISGAFKNAIDWLDILSDREPPFLSDKIIGLVSTAGGMHGLQAINTMEFCVRALRGWAVPLVMPIAQAWKAFDANGRLLDEKVEGQLKFLGREVVRAARQFAVQGYCDYSPAPLK
jgi:FMN reductase